MTNIKILFGNAHQLFLERQAIAHQAFLSFQERLYKKSIQAFLQTHNKQHQCQKNRHNDNVIGKTIKHEFLFDPSKEVWVKHHCPTYTRAALPMMSIVDMMASQCADYFQSKKLVQIKEVRIFQWAVLDKAKTIITEILIKSESQAEVTFFLKDQSKTISIAKGVFIYNDVYSVSPVLPNAIKPISIIDKPYEYLFHGPAFQIIESFIFGEKGSTMMLRAEHSIAPSGCINHVLLDGATHGVFNEEKGMRYWDENLQDLHICYPAIIRSITLYSETPLAGTIKCEARFIGFHHSKRLPIFRMTLIKNDGVWAEIEMVFVILPMGFMGKGNLKHRKSFHHFIRDRVYTREIHLAEFENASAQLSTSVTEHALRSQWFPNLIEDLYEVRDDLDLHLLTQQLLVKDFFAYLWQVHPRDVLIINKNTVAHKNDHQRVAHYRLTCHDNTFTIEQSE